MDASQPDKDVADPGAARQMSSRSDDSADARPEVIRRYFRGPRAIAATLPDVTKTTLMRRGLAAARILAEWQSIIGPELAPHTLPERIRRDTYTQADPAQGGATLVLQVSPGMAPHLVYYEKLVIDRINSFFGFAAVTKLQILQRPIPRSVGKSKRSRPAEAPPLPPPQEQKLKQDVAPIRDERLQAALERLGRRLLQPQQK